MDTAEINMTLQEAIVARHSVRQDIEKPIEAEKVQQCKPSSTSATARAGCIYS